MKGLPFRLRASKRSYVVLVIVVFGVGVENGSTQPVRHSTGQEVVPAYEGWEQNPDGSFNLVFGAMNRNWEEELDIPIGVANNIEPGGPDQGQPTHFLPRRTRFLFKIRVPEDFGDKEVVWTLTSPNGKTKRAYGTLHPDYYIDDLVFQRNNGASASAELLANKAPVLEVEGKTTRTVKVGQSVTLTAVVTDDGLLKPYDLPSRPTGVTTTSARGLRLAWFVYRATGNVVFEPEQFQVWEDRRVGSNSPWAPGWKTPPSPPDGKWVVLARFSKSGTYVLRCLAHDGGLPTHKDITFVVE